MTPRERAEKVVIVEPDRQERSSLAGQAEGSVIQWWRVVLVVGRTRLGLNWSQPNRNAANALAAQLRRDIFVPLIRMVAKETRQDGIDMLRALQEAERKAVRETHRIE